MMDAQGFKISQVNSTLGHYARFQAPECLSGTCHLWRVAETLDKIIRLYLSWEKNKKGPF